MLAHRMKILIPDSHEVTLRLPRELPSGEAEVIVLSDSIESTSRRSNINVWLTELASGVPETPVLPIDALRRENLYE
jgi:hypothetical protein